MASKAFNRAIQPTTSTRARASSRRRIYLVVVESITLTGIFISLEELTPVRKRHMARKVQTFTVPWPWDPCCHGVARRERYRGARPVRDRLSPTTSAVTRAWIATAWPTSTLPPTDDNAPTPGENLHYKRCAIFFLILPQVYPLLQEVKTHPS